MKTFIFGASGFAKEVEFYILQCNKIYQSKLEIYAFVVNDSEYTEGEKINEIKIISEKEYFALFHKNELHNCVIAVGQPNLREKIYNKINHEFTLFPSLIHPSVIFDNRSFKIGKGSIICPGN